MRLLYSRDRKEGPDGPVGALWFSTVAMNVCRRQLCSEKGKPYQGPRPSRNEGLVTLPGKPPAPAAMTAKGEGTLAWIEEEGEGNHLQPQGQLQ